MTDTRGTWILDPTNSAIKFTVKHLMFSKVQGSFRNFTARLESSSGSLSDLSVQSEIELSSIVTGDVSRDEYLRTSDFFDIKRYPKMMFRSTRVESKGKSDFVLAGQLTLHGVTREVALRGTGLPADLTYQTPKLKVSAQTQIRRKEFGLEWSGALEAGGVLVGDEVLISLEIEFKKAS